MLRTARAARRYSAARRAARFSDKTELTRFFDAADAASLSPAGPPFDMLRCRVCHARKCASLSTPATIGTPAALRRRMIPAAAKH